MASVEPPVADAAAGPTRTFIRRNTTDAMSSGQLSDGGHSLTRRTRIRKSSRREDSSSDFLTTSGEGEISSGQLFVKIPPADTRSGPSPRSAGHPAEAGLPLRPQRSPRRPHPSPGGDETSQPVEKPWATRPRTLSSGAATSHPVVDTGRGRQTCSENGESRRGQRPRVLSLPRQAFRTASNSDSSEQPSPLTPSAFNDIPPMPIFARNRRYRHQPRDSGVTHQSTTSSSLYPRSTSTGESYPSPPSLPSNDVDHHIITVDPEDNPHMSELHEMDADDVSYRLRLLMQNNYYLPPSHSKPFNEYPIHPETPKKSPSKSASPNFLSDIFKVGKMFGKAASTDSKAPKVPSGPMLRTTSDSSTVSGMVRAQKPVNPAQQQPHTHAMMLPQPRQEAKKGRVVVVRERMEDIAVVAKQVEQDLKFREAERRRNASESSHSSEELLLDGLIDPTDSVDLPPVSANAFFGPQASALNGMGVEASIGAAMLADHLPPSSPGVWSVDTEEEAWRKNLLQEAVGHSLNNSPVVTPARSPSASNPFLCLEAPGTPSPAPFRATSPSALSPRPGVTPASAMTRKASGSLSVPGTPGSESGSLSMPRRKRDLGQKILSRMIDEDEMESAIPAPAPLELADMSGAEEERQASGGKGPGHNSSLRVSSAGSYVPLRAETPTAPPHPLLPPPRRPNATPVHSGDEREEGGDGPIVNDSGYLQVSQNNPMRLSDAYESHVGFDGAYGEMGEVASPPDSLGSQHNSVTLSAVMGQPGGLIITRNASMSVSSGSQYSDIHIDTVFHTPHEHTVSTFDMSRPSLTVSVAPSFRTSSEYSRPSPTTSDFRDAFDHSPFPGSSRHSIANTLGNTSRVSSHASESPDPRYSAVSPPPRVSSSLAHVVLHPPPRGRHQYEPMPRASFDNISECSRMSLTEEPRTPIARLLSPVQLNIPADPSASASPYPASPIAFFDAVEMQSREEDEESSDEEEDNNEGGGDDTVGMTSGYQSDASAGIAVVDAHSGSVHNMARDPKQPLGMLLRQRNHSTPHLASSDLLSGGPTPRETSSALGFEALDRHRPITNIPTSPTRSTFSFKKQGKAREHQVPNPPRASESMLERLKHKSSMPVVGPKRPSTAGGRVGQRPGAVAGGNLKHDVQTWREEQDMQDQSMRRLDGMLIEHMERERDILRRITTTVVKP